jgi:hypothetical protein
VAKISAKKSLMNNNKRRLTYSEMKFKTTLRQCNKKLPSSASETNRSSTYRTNLKISTAFPALNARDRARLVDLVISVEAEATILTIFCRVCRMNFRFLSHKIFLWLSKRLSRTLRVTKVMLNKRSQLKREIFKESNSDSRAIKRQQALAANLRSFGSSKTSAKM